ncbi:zinc-binding dehydrogenase [Lentzea xinjiangensis]|uniref:zinc-binding dehydrogenase n=1 Tax=Lentzea xinjiangensis TaxID=402600 RepID=UPI001FEBDBE2|nr:zinc-binding dehydrogenase [Lentzea xinjiangensis]
MIGTGRADDREIVLGLGAQCFLDLDTETLQHVGEVDVVFDVIGGRILEQSTEVVRPGGTLVTIAMPPQSSPRTGGPSSSSSNQTALSWQTSPSACATAG